MPQNGMTMMMAGPGSGAVAAPPTGPQRLLGVTSEDGSFELLVDEPGKYFTQIESQDSRRSYPTRELEIPDVENQAVEIAFSGVPITGVVVDKDTDQPVAQASVSVSAKVKTDDWWQRASGGASGPDGRFQLEADPGDYVLTGRAEGYGPAQVDVSVTSSGLSDVRLELEHGLEIRGRVLDSSGRALSGIQVEGRSEDEGHGFAQTLPDGSFRMAGLGPKPYNVCAGADIVGYAVRAGVHPGESDLTLSLRPAGTVRLLVKGPDGMPMPKAWAYVKKIGSATFDVPFTGGRGPTDSSGLTQIPTPAGSVELEVRGEKYKGRVRLSVGEGATMGAEITVSEPVGKP
jgi:hypothetical protein